VADGSWLAAADVGPHGLADDPGRPAPGYLIPGGAEEPQHPLPGGLP
jgi:hypothetical protein